MPPLPLSIMLPIMANMARQLGFDPDDPTFHLPDQFVAGDVPKVKELLRLVPREGGRYDNVATWLPLMGGTRIFGGVILCQSMRAASLTVPPQFYLHSMHSYFLRPGSTDPPISYEVERVRDGKAYCSRLVRAYQNGKLIHLFVASYSTAPNPSAPALPSHYTPFPTTPRVPAPEECPESEERLARTLLARTSDNPIHHGGLPPFQRGVVEQWLNLRATAQVEIRDAGAEWMEDDGGEGWPRTGREQRLWVRLREGWQEDELRGREGMEIQKAALSFISDYMMLSTVPRAQGAQEDTLMCSSLDHLMWFYAPFDTSQWLLLVVESPRSADGRGIAWGRYYREDGVLVAVVSQEGIVEVRDKASPADTVSQDVADNHNDRQAERDDEPTTTTTAQAERTGQHTAQTAVPSKL